MHKLFTGVLTAILLLAAPVQSAEEPSEAAMAFVGGFSDDHLANMLSRIGSRSPVLASLSQVDGQLTAQTFDAAIADAVRAHGPAWQRNLALSWTPLLSEEELSSLTTAGAQSPFADKYLDLRTEAGQTMQGLSQDLFKEILREVLNSTLAALSPPAE